MSKAQFEPRSRKTDPGATGRAESVIPRHVDPALRLGPPNIRKQRKQGAAYARLNISRRNAKPTAAALLNAIDTTRSRP